MLLVLWSNCRTWARDNLRADASTWWAWRKKDSKCSSCSSGFVMLVDGLWRWSISYQYVISNCWLLMAVSALQWLSMAINVVWWFLMADAKVTKVRLTIQNSTHVPRSRGINVWSQNMFYVWRIEQKRHIHIYYTCSIVHTTCVYIVQILRSTIWLHIWCGTFERQMPSPDVTVPAWPVQGTWRLRHRHPRIRSVHLVPMSHGRLPSYDERSRFDIHIT